MATGKERHAFSTHLDRASGAVIFLTFTLFAAALLVKGLTHDLFLETGVLLVSVKLILNTYRAELHANRLEERVESILSLMQAQGTRDLPEQSELPQ
jgi:hypothetical protein